MQSFATRLSITLGLAEAQQAGDSSTAPETGRQSDGDAAALAADEWIEIGLIRSVHGLRGEMKVEPLTDSPAERLGTPGARQVAVIVAHRFGTLMPPPYLSCQRHDSPD